MTLPWISSEHFWAKIGLNRTSCYLLIQTLTYWESTPETSNAELQDILPNIHRNV